MCKSVAWLYNWDQNHSKRHFWQDSIMGSTTVCEMGHGPYSWNSEIYGDNIYEHYSISSLFWVQFSWSLSYKYHPGAVSIWRCRLASIGITMLKIRRSGDRLIFNMGIPYLERLSLYWDGALRSLCIADDCNTDADCLHGSCLDTELYMPRRCFCEPGWFGKTCEKGTFITVTLHGRHGVSNHQQLDCLFHSFTIYRKTSSTSRTKSQT